MQDLNIRYLYEAAKLGSMRAAAERLGVAVSSVSRQISQLEAEVGIALIEHGRRTIKLTDAGTLLVEHYAEQMRLSEAFGARLSDVKGLRTGRIHIAIGEGFIGQPLSTLLIRFNAKYTGLLLSVHMSASSNEVARMVAEDDAHLGLVFQASDDPRIRVLASVRQPLCAVMRADHPLAQYRVLKLPDLTSHKLCLPEQSLRTRQLLQAAESHEQVSLVPSITSNSTTLLKDLLQSGEFFTLLPLLAVKKEVDSGLFTAVPLDSSALQAASVQLISRLGRRLPPAPLRMLNLLMAYLEDCGAPVDVPSLRAAQ